LKRKGERKMNEPSVLVHEPENNTSC